MDPTYLSCAKPLESLMSRFDHDTPEKRQEAAMLLDPTSRLGAGDAYQVSAG